MRKFENLYAGLIHKRFVGGIDMDLLNKQVAMLPHLNIYTDDGLLVGIISIDQLRHVPPCKDRGIETFEGVDNNEAKEEKEESSGESVTIGF